MTSEGEMTVVTRSVFGRQVAGTWRIMGSVGRRRVNW